MSYPPATNEGFRAKRQAKASTIQALRDSGLSYAKIGRHPDFIVVNGISISGGRVSDILRSWKYEIIKNQNSINNIKNVISITIDSHVEDLNVSVRIHNCLRNANIKTIGELIQCKPSRLLKTYNFGKKSLEELKDALSDFGFTLTSEEKNSLEQVFAPRRERIDQAIRLLTRLGYKIEPPD